MVLAIFHPQKGPVLNSTQTAAKQLLREVLTPQGFLASPVEHTNYRRLWARDGIMCGLVGLAIDDSELIGGLRDHLLSLAAHQGPSGEIPSNLSFDSKAQVQELSYGSLVGRVDAATWFVVGACQYMLSHNDSNTEALLKPGVEKARELIRAWQFNGRGLIYVPQGGNWADDYLLEGYTLYDQVMNLWAEISWQSFSGQKGEADRLRQLVVDNYWIDKEVKSLYHPKAHAENLENAKPYLLASFKPAGYDLRFDGLGNALAVLLDLVNDSQQVSLFDFVGKLTQTAYQHLVPAFWPVVQPGDPEWSVLQNLAGPEFKNRPYEYHNGGLWPMVNGWWGLALLKSGRRSQAEAILAGLEVCFAQNGDQFGEFYHFQNGTSGGTSQLAWSGAMYLALSAALQGKIKRKVLPC